MTSQSQMPHDDRPIRASIFVAQQLVESAREYVGTKWKHRGRGKTGIDCVGLIVLAGKDCGLHTYLDDVEYTRESVGQDLLKPFREHAVENRFNDAFTWDHLRDGDILIFRDKIFPQHVGMIASRDGYKTLIHASVFYGKVVEEVLNTDHKNKALTSFRFRYLS